MIGYENIFIVLCAFIIGLSYWLVNRIILFRKGAGEMKAKEMATAFQNLTYDVGTSSDEMAQELADYVDKLTESYTAIGGHGNLASISLIPADNQLLTIDGTCYTSLAQDYYRPRRLKCVYCDCISSKESGTCEHCGAPLVEEEY
jgi:hypothetical protein